MNEKSLIPSLRFAGFADAWEQRKLGDIAVFNPKEDLPNEFEYVDLESVVGIEMLSHRLETKQSAPSRAQRLARKGDLFYQMVRPYQKNNFLFEKDEENYVFSTGYAQIRPSVDGYFVLSLIQGEKFTNTVLDNCTGTSYPAINANDLASIEVYVPTGSKEACVVGHIFRTIDRLITLHQSKHEKLRNIKKAMLDKMFPKNGKLFPEVRFSGFTAAWERRQLGDFTEISSGIMGDSLLSNGQYRLTRIETIADGYVDETRIGYTTSEPHTSYRLMKGDILYSNINSISHIGKVALYDSNSVLYHGINLLRLKPKQGTDSTFLFALLNTNSSKNWAQAHANQAVSQASINQSLLASQAFFMCEMEEQREIGKLFSILNRCISLHQRKIEKLQNIKKACLEKMFV